MKTFRVLFYRPDWDKHLLDNLIAGWSTIWNPQTWFKKLATSHVEIWTSDEQGRYIVDGRPVGYCWSSTMRKGKWNGTRRAPAEEILDHPYRWYGYTLPVCNIAFDYAMQEMEMEVANNQGYDLWALPSYFTPWRFGDPEKNICSEFCAKIICTISNCKAMVSGWEPLFRKLYKPCPSPLRLSGWLSKCGLVKWELTEELKG